ncbi:hypothetical protein [Nonomuraea salmonea]|uniref:hypothetical protein n=1 Tax=Nonomuraea salmonea TaxID=46181 RepID=UPI0031E938FC
MDAATPAAPEQKGNDMRTQIKTISGLALGLALGFGALAVPATAAAPGTAVAAQARSGIDFRVPGVRIFARADGQSTRVGLGYPGQGWEIHRAVDGTSYTCDNGVTTTVWEYGRNLRTGVVGYVPSCNTVIV